MKRVNSSLLIVLLLAMLSILLYVIQIMAYDSPRDTGFYILQDFAFLPLQIAIVTVVLGRYLKSREKSERLKKINMVINAFFSEAGTDILISLSVFNKNCGDLSAKLDIQTDWTDKLFSKTIKYLQDADMLIECSADQLDQLKIILIGKREFLIRMIENPNLLEHETFTDMLLALFHVTEELKARRGFDEDNRADMMHLSGDIQRAYKRLLVQWVQYLGHLSQEYPYLYSLEVRQNPFCKAKSPVING